MQPLTIGETRMKKYTPEEITAMEDEFAFIIEMFRRLGSYVIETPLSFSKEFDCYEAIVIGVSDGRNIMRFTDTDIQFEPYGENDEKRRFFITFD